MAIPGPRFQLARAYLYRPQQHLAGLPLNLVLPPQVRTGRTGRTDRTTATTTGTTDLTTSRTSPSTFPFPRNDNTVTATEKGGQGGGRESTSGKGGGVVRGAR